MKKLLLLALAVLCPCSAIAQTVTTPSSVTPLKAADDFATRAFQDPWDMSQKTDVGPFLGSNDVGSSKWASGFTFSGGLFSGTTADTDAQLWLLDTGNPFAAPLGRTGTNFPIDASIYKVLAVRMKVQNAASAFVYSWANDIYQSSPQLIPGKATQPGWNVYLVNLAADSSWTGLRKALRFDPAEGKVGEAVQVDWARLVAVDPSLCRPITWTGAATADIYLDTDTDPTSHLGLLQGFASVGGGSAPVANQASPGCPVVSGAYNFYTGALPAGTYKVFVVGTVGAAPTAGNAKYAPGSWVVNDVPTLNFITPTSEGSDDDFAASQLGNAWDFDKLTDVDTLFNITSPSITTLNMEAPSGASLPSQRVFQGTSAFATGGCNAIGDPVMVMLDFAKRGKNVLIDATRYRLLTVEFGIPNAPRDVNCGSIARVVWHKKGEDVNSAYTVSDDIIFNQRSGVNLLDKFTLDMATLNTEPRVATTAPNPNWTNGAGGGIDFFRFDPHEFGPATTFYVKRIKLADYERAKNSYVITWTYSKNVGTVDFWYDTDNSGFDGTLIQTGIDATLGTYTWTLPAGLATPNGGTPVYIYAIFTDTTGNSNRVYAPLPIMADSNYTQKPRLVLSRQTLNFGVLANSGTTSASQTLRMSFVGAPSTTPCWTITNSNGNFSVSPASGNGNATLTVAMVPQVFPGGGVGVATFTVNDCNPAAPTILNPGQQFTATYRISLGAPPIGAVDSPADNIQNVTGSLGVTGWVVDETDITGVKIYRNAVAGEPGDSLGRVFLGDANRVDDARPDIEAANPTAPFNYRGGWGYLLLTNFLPNLGNGTFVLKVYATDADGHETLLGQRTITCANSTAVEPFGAIDTPGQGATVTGSVNNFGWVLALGNTRADPPGGGAVSVVIDGAIVGNPGQWTTRPDLTALFPVAQYSGINTALGVFTFNSATYQDGVHTIAWLVIANNTSAAGIGSRYFTTVNGNNLVLTDTNVVAAASPISPFADLGRAARDVGRVDLGARVKAGSGYGMRTASLTIPADPTGLRTVSGRAQQRVVVDASAPGTHRYEAYLVANGTLRPLPVGASFDEARGVLYWQPGPGFSGAYDFVVVRDARAKVPVRVVLTPETYRLPVSRLVRGLFATN